ncbi:MAG TPA: MFS transporter [Pseudomonas xinjiangensis]|uniref:MFS transporter n=2 Tax=root TaxID=1 RepID=A0A7V1BSI9_9GAMM|nr:MFS transporter [Halopseudomonas xinjiangensis]HEC46991.1 MFS transporter [Halopseudomonas xinjiangensis]
MMLLFTNAQILRLFIAQALFWSCAMIGIILTSLVGLQLAPSAGLATLPLGLLVLGHLMAVGPVSSLMQRKGRQVGFVLGALAGILGGLLSAFAIWHASFTLLCLGALPLGAYQASAMFYRFAAIESVEEAYKGRATACVIGGGVGAALIAPTLGSLARDALSVPFVGAYLLVAALALVALLVLAGLRPGQASSSSAAKPAASLASLLTRPVIRAAVLTTAVGHGLMILIMTATPLAMRFHGMDVDSAAQVIQWHVLGMFLPAFIAGPLVDRLGNSRVACLGAVTMVLSASVALLGTSHLNFLLSSCLLGMGWNLMLVAGTTLLGTGHSPDERASAQGLMEFSNGSMAAIMSFAAGALITTIGWSAVNIGLLPIAALVIGVQLSVTRGTAARRLLEP